MNYDCIIVGNGAIGLSVAYEFLKKSKKNYKLALFGKKNRIGSASKAAGLMLPPFSELEHDQLKDKIYKKKFLQLDLKAEKIWNKYINELKIHSKINLKKIKDTIIINNNAASSLDEKNFNAILNYLRFYKKKFKIINPLKIPGYKPISRLRSQSAIKLEEGSIDARKVLEALDKIVERSNKCDVFDKNIISFSKKNKLIKLMSNDKKIFYTKKLIIAAGSYSKNILEKSKFKKKIQKIFFGTGVALIVKTKKKHNIRSVIRTVNRGLACGIHIVPLDEFRFYVGATNRLSHAENNNATCATTNVLINSLTKEINTDFENAIIEDILIGHRPTTEDCFPLLGELVKKQIYIATGFKRTGFFLSPIIAKELRRVILENKKNRFKEFNPLRKIVKFNKDELIEKTTDHYVSAAYQHDLNLPSFENENQYRNKIKESVIRIYKEKKLKYGVPPEILNFYRHGVL